MEEEKVYDKEGFCKDLIGLTFDQARKIIEKAGFKARKLYPNSIITMEYRHDRFNVVLDQDTDKVIKITRG